MAENQQNLQHLETEPHEPAKYPKSRFTLFLILLIVLLSLIVSANFLPNNGPTNNASYETSFQADTAMKSYYASQIWGRSGDNKFLEQSREDNRKLAIKLYQDEAKREPNTYILRRLIIIDDPKNKDQAIQLYTKVKPDSLSKKDLATEAEMWRIIYATNRPLTNNTADVYSSRIKQMQLGWYENLALHDLYSRTGLTKKANTYKQAAIDSAMQTVMIFVVLAILFFLSLIAGTALLIAYFVKRSAGWNPPPHPPTNAPQPERSYIAGYMLEVFLVYLLIMIAGSIFTSLLSRMNLLDMSRSMIFVVAGESTLSGLLALLYLRYRIKRANWSWCIIGLESTNPKTEILWGIGGYLSALPLMIIAALISQPLNEIIKTPSNPVVPLFLESSSWIEQLILFLLVAVAAPFFEEIFFRGVLLNSFSAKWGIILGVLSSSIVFAVVHPLPLSFMYILVLGSVFAVIRIRTRSLIPGMIAHAINNTVAFTVLYLITRL